MRWSPSSRRRCRPTTTSSWAATSTRGAGARPASSGSIVSWRPRVRSRPTGAEQTTRTSPAASHTTGCWLTATSTSSRSRPRSADRSSRPAWCSTPASSSRCPRWPRSRRGTAARPACSTWQWCATSRSPASLDRRERSFYLFRTAMSKGDETRRSILDQALRLASTQGLGQVTIGLLADAAGLSKSGLFAHFKSKEQLQLAVLREASDRFVGAVIAPALREPRGEPRLRALFENWLRWETKAFPGGCPFQAAADELDDQPGPVRDYLVETQRDFFDTLTTVARAGVE